MAAREETLAQAYANALLELAFEKGVHAEVLSELTGFAQVLETEPSFATFLATPRIRQDVKKALVERAFGGRVSDYTLNFLRVVIDRRRQGSLPAIVRAFVEGYHERMGELVVTIQSVVPLEDDHRARLQQAMKARYKKEIILEERIVPRLLGGLVLQVGGTRIDGSLRTRLESIAARLEHTRFRSEDYCEN